LAATKKAEQESAFCRLLADPCPMVWLRLGYLARMTKNRRKKMSGKIKELDSAENFQTETETGLVLVDFFADWCRPCQMQLPILNEVAEKMGDKVRFLKVNTDKFGDIARQFGVSGIPTLIVFKNGQVVERFDRLQQENTLVSVLGNHAATA